LDKADLKSVALVRAIEESDARGDVLSRADRLLATREMKRTNDADHDAAVVKRSQGLLGELREAGFPTSETARSLTTPKWAPASLLVAAFVIGAVFNEIESGRRFDLLALPFLGTVVWNIAVYASVIIGLFRSGNSGSSLPAFLNRLVFARSSDADESAPPAWCTGIAKFREDWFRVFAPITAQRAKALFHAAAALLALGMIAGMYLRGVSREYVAAWESTFLSPETVHTWLSILFAPAAAAISLPVPDVDAIATIRAGADYVPATAGPWIHLSSATLVLFVVLPRLALATQGMLRSRSSERNAAAAFQLDDYYASLQSPQRANASRVVVVPYGAELTAKQREVLLALTDEACGAGSVVDFCAAAEYGDDETEALARIENPANAQSLFVLFGLTSIPEEEIQIALVAGLTAQLGDTNVVALIDASRFHQRFGKQADFENRLAERTKLWRSSMAQAGTEPLIVDLDNPDMEAWTDDAAQHFQSTSTAAAEPDA
jgi:hypothetical protein